MTVIRGDDERHSNTRDADPAEAAEAKLVEAVDGVRLRGAADRKLREHNGEADENYDGKIDQDVSAAAALKGLAGKLPDVAETDGAAGGGKDEADLASPLRTIVFHVIFSFFLSQSNLNFS